MCRGGLSSAGPWKEEAGEAKKGRGSGGRSASSGGPQQPEKERRGQMLREVEGLERDM